jgi:predicted metalloprotease with PDZ domain
MREGTSNCWTYPGFEILLDTPVVFGKFELISRSIKDVPFYFVFVDRGVGFDQQVNKFVDQLSVAVEKIHDVFGLFPFTDYTFVLSLNPQADWGLEHLTSNMSGLGPEVFVDDDQFANGIRVCAHELFHAWNVRRLRPATLGQLVHKLSRGCFTEGLWFAEGFTRYYEFLISTRAKAYNPAKFFSAVLGYYQHLSQQPAYKRETAADSSLATYMNHSKYPGRVNNAIDYYDKGMLIAFGLDVHLRLSTTDNHLDNALREFYLRYFGDGSTVPANYVGYTTDDVVSFFNEIQAELGTRVGQLVQQPAGLDTLEKVEQLGFEINWQHTYTLGLFFLNANEPTIYGVADDGAGGQVGIAPGDVIEAINGYAFTPSALKWVASQVQLTRLTVMRGHRKLNFELTPQPLRKVRSLIWRGSQEQAQTIGSWLEQDDFSPLQGQVFELDFYENFHGIETMV